MDYFLWRRDDLGSEGPSNSSFLSPLKIEKKMLLYEGFGFKISVMISFLMRLVDEHWTEKN